MGRLEGRTAFITGAGAGIAKAAAKIFSREGAQVAIAEINQETGRITEQTVKDAGGEAFFVHTDVSKEDSVRAAVAATVKRFGKIDVLYNCAGGALPIDSHITDVDFEKVWDFTMMVDFKGTLLCCRHVIPEIIKAGGGTIVNMSSGAALRGAAPGHIYSAAKGGILSFTRALAGAYAKQNIRANAICAGRILTELSIKRYGTPGQPGSVVDRQDMTGRLKEYPLWVGQPEDIANVGLFLACNESRMITGATIAADGGRSSF